MTRVIAWLKEYAIVVAFACALLVFPYLWENLKDLPEKRVYDAGISIFQIYFISYLTVKVSVYQDKSHAILFGAMSVFSGVAFLISPTMDSRPTLLSLLTLSYAFGASIFGLSSWYSSPWLWENIITERTVRTG